MLKKALIFGVLTYKKWVSPYIRKSCRYYPTCSSYAVQSLEKHGALMGSYMAISRILRCNGFFSGGFDPVR